MKRMYKLQIPNRKMYPGVGTVLSSIEPPCAATSRKRPPIQNTKIFPVIALQLERLVNDHLL